MIVATAPTLSEFEGRWQIDRRIRDHLAGTTGQFEGTAVFRPDGDGLAYHETGHLHLPGHAPFLAERRYRWREDGGRLTVEFEDGRFFHSFGSADRAASHWCDPDTYIVHYDFDGWPIWQAKWEVSGPRKAYEMISVYRPLSA
ncbi:MAG: DUF6314 family protein [Marivita sp.]|uniref:DUF6314 family protein n=1 Tax=Marivita sp. TaxID=2003365 RepID=UPI0025C519B0|nr:DUF6314 family protein [Marivita sp.]MCI5112098.1 DUF6314 family protein [Marivita sp.]